MKLEPIKTVQWWCVNSAPQTPTVQRVLDCAQIVLIDLLQVQIERNAVNEFHMFICVFDSARREKYSSTYELRKAKEKGGKNWSNSLYTVSSFISRPLYWFLTIQIHSPLIRSFLWESTSQLERDENRDTVPPPTWGWSLSEVQSRSHSVTCVEGTTFLFTDSPACVLGLMTGIHQTQFFNINFGGWTDDGRAVINLALLS